MYLENVRKLFAYYRSLGEQAMQQVTDEQLFIQPNETSNSIAIIVQHLTGNMLSRFSNFLTEDGEKEWRTRDDEFEIHHYSKQQVMALWEKGWKCFLDAMGSLTEDDLLKTIYTKSFRNSSPNFPFSAVLAD